jgi:hypothetical protein
MTYDKDGIYLRPVMGARIHFDCEALRKYDLDEDLQWKIKSALRALKYCDSLADIDLHITGSSITVFFDTANVVTAARRLVELQKKIIGVLKRLDEKERKRRETPL